MLAVGAEPDGPGVGDDLLLVHPVAHAVEDGAGNTCTKNDKISVRNCLRVRKFVQLSSIHVTEVTDFTIFIFGF